MGIFNFGRVPLFKSPSGGVNPVTFDASSNTTAAFVTSRTFAHTVSGSNRYLVVKVSLSSTSPTVTGVTYNGVAMTLITSLNSTLRVELWGLVAPATGSNNVIVSFSGSAFASIGASSYNNVNQASPTSGAVTATGTNATPTVNVTSATNSMVTDVVGCSIFTLTVGAGQTQEFNTSTAGIVGAGSREAGAGSVTMSWTLSLAERWLIAAVSLLNET